MCHCRGKVPESVPREAHDALFRVLASDVRSAASLIRRYAPPALVRILTDAPPRLQESTLVQPRRGKVQADALFEVELRDGRRMLVQVLFEHLSRWKRETPLKLLEYMLGAWWRSDRKPARRSLKPVIPVLICHGLGDARVPESFMELYDIPRRLAEELNLLDFGISVHELERIPDRELADDPATRGALLAMKISRWEDPPIAVLLAVLTDLADRPEDSLVRMEATGYVLDTLKVSEKTQQALLEAEDPEVQDMVAITIAERLHRRGFDEGLAKGQAEGLVRGQAEGLARGQAEGLARGQAEMLLELLGERFGQVPAIVVDRIRSAEPAELRSWSKTLMHAHDLDDIFGPDPG